MEVKRKKTKIEKSATEVIFCRVRAPEIIDQVEVCPVYDVLTI